jgi:hypothetical protein
MIYLQTTMTEEEIAKAEDMYWPVERLYPQTNPSVVQVAIQGFSVLEVLDVLDDLDDRNNPEPEDHEGPNSARCPDCGKTWVNCFCD